MMKRIIELEASKVSVESTLQSERYGNVNMLLVSVCNATRCFSL